MPERPSVVSEPAPAKLNPFLRVLRRRNDGFHEIETLVLPITLADGVRAEADEPGAVSLALAGEERSSVPRDAENLAVRAALELQARCGPALGARLMLVKRIPVAAGLGGGSADAAATLRALNDLWGCGLASDELAEVGGRVGSDVPALVPGGAVLARGRGEVVEPIEIPKTWWVVVAASGVGAADAYGWWDQDGREPGPDPGPLLEALRSGDLEAVGQYLVNDLETPAVARRPEVGASRRRLLEAGAVAVVMCGSGPSVAGLARDGAHAEEIARACEGIAVSSLRS